MISKDRKGKNVKVNDEVLTDKETAEQKETVAQEAEKEEVNNDSKMQALEAELDNCKAELEKYKALSDEYKLMAQRERADFENYKKRNASLRADAYDDGVKDSISQLLPIIDNFERAIKASEEKSDIKPVIEGIKSINKQISDYLKNINVTEIPALDCQFNPDLHNAVLHTEEEGKSENTITEVMQKGYMYKDKVIRYSMVKVIN